MNGQPQPPAPSRARVEARREALAWVLAMGLLWLVYQVVRSFLSPLIWATVLSIFAYPAHRRLLAKLPRRNVAALLSTTTVALLMILPVALLTPVFVVEAADAVSGLRGRDIVDRIERGLDYVSTRIPPAVGDLNEMLDEAVKALRNHVGGWSAKLVANFAGFILDCVVLVLALFYLFRDGPGLVEMLREVSPFGGERHDVMMRQAIDMISVTISSGFVVAAVQGLLGGLSFAILDLPSPLLWGVVTALMAFLPLVGAWMVWLPAGIGLLLSGQVGRGLALLAMGVLLISTVDNVLRPILISDRSQLNGLLVFISVLGGIQAFGLLGIVLGPLVMAAAVGLLTGYRDSLLEGDNGAA
ncbi:MAG: AI-2E family transporter [Acidobacteria bacterium]|nr:AI-2E family transporter [Acidobacteriota bacterium]